MTIKVTGIRITTGVREELNEFAAQAWRDGTTSEAFTDIREDLPAALTEIERIATHAATWKALARRLLRRYRSERRGHDLTRSDRKKHRAEIERLTAELAARAPADASLEARAEALERAICDKLGPLAPAPPKYFRDTCIDLVRAVDASRPALPGHLVCPMCAGKGQAPERIVWGPENGGDPPPWERDASRPGLTEEQAREIAADVAASFNARWSIGLGQGPLKDMADRIEAGVLRASRGTTGLTEEQARRDFEAAIRDAVAKGGAYCNTHAREAVAALDAALLRAARGETGPATVDPPTPDRPAGLTRAMHDAAQRPSVPPRIEYEHGPDGETYRVEDDWQPCACGAAVSRGEAHPTGPGHDVDWSAVDRQRATPHAGAPASLADVVAASAREPHADVVLQALHVSGGAAAVDAIRKVALNPNGTIREQDAHRVEQALRAAGIEATVDRGHNVLADGAVKLTPREP